MHSLFKSTALAAGLVAAVTATAYAQSVSALPPTSSETATTATMPPVSSAKIIPSPGNETVTQQEHYTAVPSDNDPARHPYTAPHFAPAPN